MTRGYSLMELVVVLAILAVAASVVAPAVGRTADDVIEWVLTCSLMW